MMIIFFLNKIWNFYNYVHLMYNVDWNLNLSSKFSALLMLKKFENAKHYHKILEFIYFTFKFDIQISDFWIAFNKSIFVCISSAVVIIWFLNYNIYFANHLKMYFVKSLFWHEFDSVFQALCIEYDMFELAINNFNKCFLFKFLDDQAWTIFMISQFTLNKFIIFKKINKKSISINEFYSEKKIL